MKKYLPNSTKGFTLIELLVVISIIAVLATIGVSTFNIVQRNARDGKSQADINAIANSIETSRDINSGTGAVTYTYTSANLTSDFKTTPAGKNAYCMRSSNTASEVNSNPATTGWTASVCPTNYTNISTGGFPSSNSYWRVCALMESGTVYCKNDRSQ